MASQSCPIIPSYNIPNSVDTFQPPALDVASISSSNATDDSSLSSNGGPSVPVEDPPGYPRLAELMGHYPEVAVFRRFGSLNLLNILCLQAELMQLEGQLRERQSKDHASPHGCKKFYARNWYFLSASARDGDERQLKLCQLASEKLEKYNTALIQQEKILSMQSPGAYDMNYLQRYLASTENGRAYALTGLDCDIWGSYEKPNDGAVDLVTLKPRRNQDGFSNWVTGKRVTKIFEFGLDKFLRPSQVRGMVGYKDTTLLRLTYQFTSILASLLPIASIAILYQVHSTSLRLAIIAVFNIILSLCLTTFTTARRTDVFAVAAAFSAVQVVFIQGQPA